MVGPIHSRIMAQGRTMTKCSRTIAQDRTMAQGGIMTKCRILDQGSRIMAQGRTIAMVGS